MTAFLFLLRNWKILTVIIPLIVAGLLMLYLKIQLDFARKARDLAEDEAMQWQEKADDYLAANIENQAAFEAYKKQAAEWADLAARQIAASAKQTKIINEIKKEITDAPEQDNRNVGPILNSTLDCLRQYQQGAATCHN